MSFPKPEATAGSTPAVSHRYKPWTVLARPSAQGSVVPEQVALTRRFEVSYVDDSGDHHSFIRIAPALPIFEEAFSAFSHGAVVPTTEGPVSVEDLEPGMALETASGNVVVLRWKGAITLVPNAPSATGETAKLYRVSADAFGLGRPSSDVTLGPAARLINRDPAIRNALGCDAALAKVASFADGVSVAELTPPSPVRVYHLAFDRHQILKVGGLEVESFHPGPDAHYSMSQEMRAVFLSLFPHIVALQDFGRVLWPRVDNLDDGNLEIV